MAIDLRKITDDLKDCPCGKKHEININSIQIGRGVLQDTGKIMKDAGIGKKLHVVADKNTLAASDGILDILAASGFQVDTTIYDDMQSSTMDDVKYVMSRSSNADALLSIGTGSLNDICRYSCGKTGQQFAIFATAPSMDGFASVMAPITENGFKRTFPAVGPDVIIADADILAHSPVELKAAGLGDLLGKYTALADWRVAALTTGEYYCPEIAALTKGAVDEAVRLARTGNAQKPDPVYASALMEALILSGLAMFLSGCTRPASGAEHHVAHFWEMSYQMRGYKQVFHGKKVGIACGMVCDVYHNLAKLESIETHQHVMETEILKKLFGPLYPELLKENTPDPVSTIEPVFLKNNWDKIREILSEVPTGNEIRELLRIAGGAPDCKSAGIPDDLAYNGIRYGFYARFRITAMRIARSIICHGEEIFQ